MRTKALFLTLAFATMATAPALAGPSQDLGVWDGTLLVSAPVNCRSSSSCHELEDISIRDIDISAEMARVHPGNTPRYSFSDLVLIGSGTLVSWLLCMYTDTGAVLGCHRSGSSGGMGGVLNDRTHSVRVILDIGADRSYRFYMFAS